MLERLETETEPTKPTNTGTGSTRSVGLPTESALVASSQYNLPRANTSSQGVLIFDKTPEQIENPEDACIFGYARPRTLAACAWADKNPERSQRSALLMGLSSLSSVQVCHPNDVRMIKDHFEAIPCLFAAIRELG